MEDIIKQAAGKCPLVAAHRGFAAGNIPCNTLASFEAALRCGADIIEIDITPGADGELFVFHPGKEPFHLGIKTYIPDMTAAEVRALRYRNYDHTPTQYPVSTLDELFEHFKGRCFVNLDKFWTCMPEITACVRRHKMADWVIAKSYPADECLDFLEAEGADIPFMPFINREDDVTEDLLKRNIRLLGAEAHFLADSDPVASDAYVEAMHEKGLLVWANAIVFDYKSVESAGHTDDIAMTGDPDAGWGWLARKGFDIIQTDWPGPMRDYLRQEGFLLQG